MTTREHVQHAPSAKCTAIGYWFSEDDENAHLPKAQDHVDATWDTAERDRVVAYLEDGRVANSYRGMSFCRFCDAWNGSEDCTDSTYVWPSGLAHYLKEHAVRLPAEFVAHVLSRPAPAMDRVAVLQRHLHASEAFPRVAKAAAEHIRERLKGR